MRPSIEMGSIFLKKDFNFPEIPPLDLADFPDYARGINFPLSADVEFKMEGTVDAPSLGRFLGIDFGSADTFTIQFSQPHQEQVRRHKKKRINKKWAKRYGYRTKTKIREIENVSFHQTNPGEYEFVGRGIK